MTTENHHKLATAVIHWLSEFSHSPVSTKSSWQVLADPVTLFQLLDALITSKDLQLRDDTLELFSNRFSCTKDQNGIHVPEQLMRQVEYLSFILHGHLHHRVDLNVVPPLNLYKLILYEDNTELKYLCQILLLVGTHTSREASCGQSFIEFLSDDDRSTIMTYDIRQSTNVSRQRLEKEDNTVRSTDKGNQESSFVGEGSYCISEDEYKTMKWENAILERVLGDITTSYKTKLVGEINHNH